MQQALSLSRPMTGGVAGGSQGGSERELPTQRGSTDNDGSRRKQHEQDRPETQADPWKICAHGDSVAGMLGCTLELAISWALRKGQCRDKTN